MRQRLKRMLYGLLGKDPEAIVVSFLTGNETSSAAMLEEVRRLLPDRRHYAVRLGKGARIEGVTIIELEPNLCRRLYAELRRAFRKYRIGMAPVLFTTEPQYRALRNAAFLLAPSRILAYNSRLERHHLRLQTAIASWLFLRGVPLDRIYLRPRWLCPWKRDRSKFPSTYKEFDGRPLSPLRRRVGVLSPYFPYPLSHGGAVRIYNLLKEAAERFDLFLFAFAEGDEECEPVLAFCSKVVLVPKARYREPGWSTLRPPEACEYNSPLMRRLIQRFRREYGLELLQVEYTQLAGYKGDVLVEHDVTFDLYGQILDHERQAMSRTPLAAWWNWWRWHKFERRAVRRYARVVAMSEKDAGLLGDGRVRVIPNGVDLERFRPEPERPGRKLLFIGSFRHFPNVAAYRFFTEQVWPLLLERVPDAHLTVVAGPDPLLHWRLHTGAAGPPEVKNVRMLGFVRDVAPLYADTNLVIVPTIVSAGTNLKVLEAMAAERAVVSTTSGCAGLELKHEVSVWVADDPQEFAAGILRLFSDDCLRRNIARAARHLAEERYSWSNLGALQRALWSELMLENMEIRPAVEKDLEGIGRIQAASPEAVAWNPSGYLAFHCRVAIIGGKLAGFIAFRHLGDGEGEILNLAVDPQFRRQGVARRLLQNVLGGTEVTWFLEVRETNLGAQALYLSLGFRKTGWRPGYYDDTGEGAVVMRLQSC